MRCTAARRRNVENLRRPAVIFLWALCYWSACPSTAAQPAASTDDGGIELDISENGPAVQFPELAGIAPANAATLRLEIAPGGEGQLQMGTTAGELAQGALDVQLTGPNGGRAFIQAVNDSLVEGPHSVALLARWLGTGGEERLRRSVRVAIEDNDEGAAGILILKMPPADPGPGPLVVLEGEMAEVSVQLAAPADQLVVVHVEGPVHDDLEITPKELLFTAANYDVPQILRIRASRDGIDQGMGASTLMPPLVLRAESLTPAYAGLREEMDVALAEADIAQVLISPRGLELVEGGGEGLVAISLATIPTHMVTISLDDPSGQVSLYPKVLVYLPHEPPAPQEVRVIAPLDGLAATDRRVDVYLNPQSADRLYASYGGVLRVQVADNSRVGMQLAPEVLRMAEGTSSQFSLALASQPLATVVVGIECGSPAAQLSTTSVKFKPGDWAGRDADRWRAVTLTVPPDGVARGTITWECHFSILEAVDLTYFTLTDFPVLRVDVLDVDLPAVCFGACELDPEAVVQADYTMPELSFVNGVDTKLNCTLATPPLALVQLLIYEVDLSALAGDRSLTLEPEDWASGRQFNLIAVPTEEDVMRLTTFCILSVSEDIHYNGIRRCVSLNLVPADPVQEDPDCPPVRWGCPPPRAPPRSDLVRSEEGGIVSVGMGLSVAFGNVSESFAAYNLTAPFRFEVASQQLQDWSSLACPPLFELYRVMGMFVLDTMPPYASESPVGLQWELPGGGGAAAEEGEDERSDYHFLVADDQCPLDIDIRALSEIQLIAACRDCAWYLHLATAEPSWQEQADAEEGIPPPAGANRRFATTYLDSMPTRHIAIVRVRPTITVEPNPPEAGRAMEFVENTPGVPLLPPLALRPVVQGNTPYRVLDIEVSIGGTLDAAGGDGNPIPRPSLSLAELEGISGDIFTWTWSPDEGILRILRVDGSASLMYQVNEALARVRFQVGAGGSGGEVGGAQPRVYVRVVEEISTSFTFWTTVTVVGTPDPPTLRLEDERSDSTQWSRVAIPVGGGFVPLLPSLRLEDVDSGSFRSAKVWLEPRFGEDVLQVVVPSSNEGMRVLLQPDGTWALHGVGELADYEATLRALRLRNDGPVFDWTKAGQRVLRVEVVDASGLPAVLSRPISIVSSSTPPVVKLVGDNPMPAVAGTAALGRLAAGDPTGAVPLAFRLICAPALGDLTLAPDGDGSFTYTSTPTTLGLDTFLAEVTNAAGRTTLVAASIAVGPAPLPARPDSNDTAAIEVDLIRVWAGRNNTVFLPAASAPPRARLVVTSEPRTVSLHLSDEALVQPGSTRRLGRHPLTIYSPPDTGIATDEFEYAVVVEADNGLPAVTVRRRRVLVEVIQPTGSGSVADLAVQDITLRMDARPNASLTLEASLTGALANPLATGARAVEFVVVDGPVGGGSLHLLNSTSVLYQRDSFNVGEEGQVSFRVVARHVPSGLESAEPATVVIEVLGEWAWRPVPVCALEAKMLAALSLKQDLSSLPIRVVEGVGVARWWEAPLAAELAAAAASSSSAAGLAALSASLEALSRADGAHGGRIVCSARSTVRARMAAAEPGGDAGGVVLGLLADFDPTLDGDAIADYVITRLPEHGTLRLWEDVRSPPSEVDWLSSEVRLSASAGGRGVPALASYRPEPLARGTPLDSFEWVAVTASGRRSAPATVEVHVSCAVGFRQEGNGSSCTRCEPGLVTLAGAIDAMTCVPCRAGSIAAADATACLLCPDDTYQPVEGGAACLPCADPLMGAPKGSTHPSACLCAPGTFGTTDTCVACPIDGSAVCELTNQPLPLPGRAGLWVDPGIWSQPGILDDLPPEELVIVHRCRPVGACEKLGTADEVATGRCAAGYTGFACSSCADGYERSADRQCVPAGCTADALGRWAAALLASVVTAAVLWRAVSGDAPTLAALRLCLVAAARLALVATLDVGWSAAMRPLADAAAAFSLASPHQLLPSCGLSELSAGARHALQLAAGAAVVWAVLLLGCANILARRYGAGCLRPVRKMGRRLQEARRARKAAKRASKGQPAGEEAAAEDGTAAGREERAGQDKKEEGEGKEPGLEGAQPAERGEEEVQGGSDARGDDARAVQLLLVFLLWTFALAANVSLSYFSCHEAPGGQRLLDAEPAVECGAEGIATLLPLMAATALVFVIGLPAGLAGVLCSHARLLRWAPHMDALGLYLQLQQLDPEDEEDAALDLEASDTVAILPLPPALQQPAVTITPGEAGEEPGDEGTGKETAPVWAWKKAAPGASCPSEAGGTSIRALLSAPASAAVARLARMRAMLGFALEVYRPEAWAWELATVGELAVLVALTALGGPWMPPPMQSLASALVILAAAVASGVVAPYSPSVSPWLAASAALGAIGPLALAVVAYARALATEASVPGGYFGMPPAALDWVEAGAIVAAAVCAALQVAVWLFSRQPACQAALRRRLEPMRSEAARLRRGRYESWRWRAPLWPNGRYGNVTVLDGYNLAWAAWMPRPPPVPPPPPPPTPPPEPERMSAFGRDLVDPISARGLTVEGSYRWGDPNAVVVFEPLANLVSAALNAGEQPGASPFRSARILRSKSKMERVMKRVVAAKSFKELGTAGAPSKPRTGAVSRGATRRRLMSVKPGTVGGLDVSDVASLVLKQQKRVGSAGPGPAPAEAPKPASPSVRETTLTPVLMASAAVSRVSARSKRSASARVVLKPMETMPTNKAKALLLGLAEEDDHEGGGVGDGGTSRAPPKRERPKVDRKARRKRHARTATAAEDAEGPPAGPLGEAFEGPRPWYGRIGDALVWSKPDEATGLRTVSQRKMPKVPGEGSGRRYAVSASNNADGKGDPDAWMDQVRSFIAPDFSSSSSEEEKEEDRSGGKARTHKSRKLSVTDTSQLSISIGAEADEEGGIPAEHGSGSEAEGDGGEAAEDAAPAVRSPKAMVVKIGRSLSRSWRSVSGVRRSRRLADEESAAQLEKGDSAWVDPSDAKLGKEGLEEPEPEPEPKPSAAAARIAANLGTVLVPELARQLVEWASKQTVEQEEGLRYLEHLSLTLLRWSLQAAPAAIASIAASAMGANPLWMERLPASRDVEPGARLIPIAWEESFGDGSLASGGSSSGSGGPHSDDEGGFSGAHNDSDSLKLESVGSSSSGGSGGGSGGESALSEEDSTELWWKRQAGLVDDEDEDEGRDGEKGSQAGDGEGKALDAGSNAGSEEGAERAGQSGTEAEAAEAEAEEGFEPLEKYQEGLPPPPLQRIMALLAGDAHKVAKVMEWYAFHATDQQRALLRSEAIRISPNLFLPDEFPRPEEFALLYPGEDEELPNTELAALEAQRVVVTSQAEGGAEGGATAGEEGARSEAEGAAPVARGGDADPSSAVADNRPGERTVKPILHKEEEDDEETQAANAKRHISFFDQP